VTAGLAGAGDLWAPRPPRTRGAVIGTAVALAIHLGVAALLVRVDASRFLHANETVEMDVEEPPPPPPEVKPETPPPPPAPEDKPRVIVHHAPVEPAPEAPPPPTAEPPKANAVPPSFGVSLDSTVGTGPGIAVPVGSTLMTKPTKGPAGPAGPLPAASGDGDSLPAPVPEISIAEPPKVAHEVTAPYPPDLQRMGIEGSVVAKLYIDENGDVRRVTVTEKAGHGFDELAREALKKFKFTPARTSDGKAVPTNIIYKYKFELPQ
jgi:periplasmic protein TonB